MNGPPTTHPASEHMQHGQPASPLPVGSARGTAMAIGALMQEALSGRPQRLVWCVDSERDVGVPVATNEGPDPWLVLLHRFKGALDRLAWGPSSARLALALRTKAGRPGCDLCRYDHRGADEGRPCPGCAPTVVITFAIPYAVDLTALCRAAPPVGKWRTWPDPDPTGARGAPRDNLPPTFFLDGIPF